MEAFLITILIVSLIMLYKRFGDVKQLLEQQRSDMTRIQAELRSLRDTLTHQSGAPEPVRDAPSLNERVPDIQASPVREPLPPMAVPAAPPPAMPALQPVPEPPGQARPQPAPVPKHPTPPRPSFVRRFLTDNPDLEKFIGENLINKIGIAILVAGIGYFVRYAIDQNWIGEVGRVLIGILAGGLLLGLAHRTRQTFGAFSSVLVAGGVSVLYFTIAIAFSEYKLFSQTAAFGIMVVITTFAILLSLAYNRVELAVLSLIGGFATPFMVSTGQSNYVVLFTYLLILDVGMLVLAYFRRWNLVHMLAHVFTVLLYVAWLSTEGLTGENPPYGGVLLFATLFYVVFMAMNLIYNLKERNRFSSLEIGLLLSSTAFYYAAGMIILSHLAAGAWQGLFTAVLALTNFGLLVVLRRRNLIDPTLLYLLIGLVMTFVSLTVPVQLDGNFITMFWGLEAVLLLWLAQRSGLRLVSTGSVIVLGLMFISLLLDWESLYERVTEPFLPVLVNKAFITGMLAVVALGATYWLLSRQTEPILLGLRPVNPVRYRQFIGYSTLVVTYLVGLFELNYQLVVAYDDSMNRTITLGTYHLLWSTGLLAAALRFGDQPKLRQATTVALFIILIYLTDFGPAVLTLLEHYYRGTDHSRVGFPVHYLSLMLLAVTLILLFRNRSRLEPLPPAVTRLWPWALGFVLVYVASWELFAHVVYLTFSATDVAPSAQTADRYASLLTQTSKVGLPILWGLCAFGFMYAGLKQRNRAFRILSLSLFALTLLKLFFYDLRGISEGGRIAAFISLGVLLLIISFMYQKIKRLILTSDATPPPTDHDTTP